MWAIPASLVAAGLFLLVVAWQMGDDHNRTLDSAGIIDAISVYVGGVGLCGVGVVWLAVLWFTA